MSTQGERLSTVMGHWTLILAVYALPMAMIWMMFQPIEYIQGYEFHEYWRGLLLNIKKGNKSTIIYYLIFILRRLIFV